MKRLLVSLVALVIVLAPAEAGATTICVPSFHAACPNSGGNVAETDIEKALGIDGWDGEADQVIVAAGTFTENGSYEPPGGVFKNPGTIELEGSDDLTVTGAGMTATRLTSGGTENIVLLDLASSGNVRDVVLRDLTVQIPTSFPNGLGAGLRLHAGDLAERVWVESLNTGSDGVLASGAGNVFRGGEVFPGIGGQLGVAFRASSEKAGLLVESTHIFGAATNLNAGGKEATLIGRRVFAEETTAYGAASSEGSVTVENSVIRMSDGIGLFVSPASNDASVDADHVTIVDDVAANPALEAKKFAATAGDGTISVTNSILRGFGSGHKIESPGGSGVLRIEASYSNFSPGGTNIGGGVTDFGPGNINADPLFLGLNSLSPGSPSIDAGDPAPGGLTSDFLAALRPVDGDGDGLLVRDQGAHEYQPPAPPGDSGGGGAAPPPGPIVIVDRRANTILTSGPGKKLAQGKAKFTFRANVKGARFVCKLDRRKGRACKSPQAYTGLKPGRHVFRVWAISFGKDRTPAVKRFRVPPR